MDKLQAMRNFVRVVEAGSFSAVAHESNTTQSAVSKQVAALERELGAKLLTRTTRSLALTEEGGRYFAEARRLVAEIAEAEGALRRGEQQLVGWLRVASSVGFGRFKLMPLIQSFLAEHRDLKIDLRLSDGFVDLVEQGIDVAVRIGRLADSSLVARPVATTHRVLLAHRSYVPNWMFDGEIASGELQRLLPDWEAPPIPIHLVSPPERRHSAKVKAFSEYVARRMAAA